MSDVMTPEQRSRCMSRIRGRDTKPELALRRALWARGLRYRVNKRLPGKPDIAFLGAKVAIFVDGCFWHGCPQHAVRPKSNVKFWTKKITRNKERDGEVNDLLRDEGWTVLRFWEHEVRDDVEAIAITILSEVGKHKHSGG